MASVQLPYARVLLLPAIVMAAATGAAVALVTEPARIAVGVCGAVATLLVAATATEAVPLLAQLRLASRSWRSDLVPADGLPAVGPVPAPGLADGLYRLGGLGADPLALAPAAAEALAQHLVDEEPIVSLRPFEPGRQPARLRVAGAGSRSPAATAR